MSINSVISAVAAEPGNIAVQFGALWVMSDSASLVNQYKNLFRLQNKAFVNVAHDGNQKAKVFEVIPLQFASCYRLH